jgi:signal transduction histidine kinase/CheY-like chemotaxis protein
MEEGEELRRKIARLEEALAQEKRVEEELRQTEERLRISHERFSAVMDSLDAVVLVTHLETYEILFANKLGREAFGADVGSACWKSFGRDQNGPCHFCSKNQLLDPTGEPGGVHVCQFKSAVTNQWYELHSRAIKWVDGSLVRLEIANNITERIKTEEEILKSKNLESLGILAGGIAHNFNNLLAIIMGNISLVELSSHLDSKLRRYLEKASNAIVEAKDLTSQLLTFSRGDTPIYKSLSISKIVKNIVGNTISGTNVACDYLIDPSIKPVFVDETQVSIALRHIVTNAMEAMPNGGVISISGKNIHASALNSLPLDAGEYVKISIADQGAGIPETNLKNIFDPYFTTKPPGKDKNAGLGLSIAYSIIKKHSGYIDVQSSEKEGTRVDIYLPASREMPDEKPTVGILKIPEPEPPAKSRKLLVMDDERFILELYKQMASELGFDCQTAVNGDEAIRQYIEAMEKKEPFDVVILDLTIKDGLGGKRTVQKLQELDPNVYAVVSSGYSNDEVLENSRAYGFKSVLPKPFTIDDLKTILSQ